MASVMFLCATALLAFAIAQVHGAPNGAQKEIPVTPEEIAALAPYTHFAAAAYCDSSLLKDWTCGQACDAIPGFKPTLAGGDGNAVQIYFVGYWSQKNTVVVAHEGTDPTKFLSVLTDANIFKSPLDRKLFPGVPPTAWVHDGFRRAHAKTATLILAEVEKLMIAHNTRNLTIVGHSLGGAIAELDSLFFALNLPNITIKAVTYGAPRVGNLAFAQLINEHVPGFTRVNNRKDPIPIVPPRFLGFSHPAGEIHILSSKTAVACTGNDNTIDPNCSNSLVPIVAKGSILDHLGSYRGIYIGTIFCDG